jgi:serine/threonine-protein kinase RsbW
MSHEVTMHRLFQETCPLEASHTHARPELWQRLSLCTTDEMDRVITNLLQALSLAGYSGHETFGVRLALEEAIVNAIKHGHHNDASKQVEVRYHLSDDCLLAEVQDQGPGFDPGSVPDPLAPENLDREGGRGLHLMRCYMTWVRYNQSGNCVTMCKRRSLETVRGQRAVC